MASMAWLTLQLALAICVLIGTGESHQSEDGGHHVKVITRNDFSMFSQKSSVTIIYFFRKDVVPIQNFLKEYEKSAELLEMYNVELAKLDCFGTGSPEASEYCDKEGSEEHLYAFRDGHELLALPLENTFDVNSIMSNILQIVLLREVPIIQTREERADFEQQNKGSYDIILSYQAAIGTYEHRVLMEIAFAYHHKYKFVITTEKPVVADLIGSGTEESSMLWVLQCQKAAPKMPCEHSKFMDNIDLVSLARFIKAFNLDLVHDIADSGVAHPYDDQGLHKVLVYYSLQQQAQVKVLAERISNTFYGVVGVIMVQVEHPQAALFGYMNGVTKVPGVAILLRGSNEPIAMTAAFTSLSVEAFVGRILESTLRRTLSIAETDSYIDEATDQEEALLAAVEKQDDQVAEAVQRLNWVEIDRTNLPALTDRTFPTQTADSQLLVVLFYVTFDARSMAFLRSYVDASHVLAKMSLNHLAAVDCFDWTDVCGQNNITSYPTIRIYRQGKEPREYKGMLGAAPIVSLVKMLMTQNPAVLSTQKEGTKFLKGLYPTDLKGVTDVAVLGLFDKDHKNELKIFKQVAMQEHGKTAFGFAKDDALTQMSAQFNVQPPAVVVYKRHDMWSDHRVYQGEMTPSAITNFVKESSLPVFPELTPVNFPAIFARKLPLVILFDEHVTPGRGAHAEVAATVQSGEFSGFSFGWMELTRDDGVAGKVLLEYDQQAEPPSLFMVNHATGFIYNYGMDTVNQEAVTAWLDRIVKNEATPWKTLEEGEWKPLNPGYDFLKMIDEENAEEDQAPTDAPMPIPKVDYEFKLPGEEEEREIREALKMVWPKTPEGSSEAHDAKHTEL